MSAMCPIVDAADACIGFIMRRGVCGFEGFNREIVSLGFFKNEAEAAKAVVAAAEQECGAG
jgi:hypothetical protein